MLYKPKTIARQNTCAHFQRLMFRPCSFKNAMHGKITHKQFAGRMPTRSPIKATAFLRTRQRIVERIKMTAFMANGLCHRKGSPNRSVVVSSGRGRVTSCFEERPKMVAAAKNALKAFGKRCKSNWLVVSTHLKNISQNGNLPQIGVKIKNI